METKMRKKLVGLRTEMKTFPMRHGEVDLGHKSMTMERCRRAEQVRAQIDLLEELLAG